jgi:galactose mutarotase-like enzyme
MSVKIENNSLLVKIHNKGAEVFSVRNKTNRLEYFWNGDPEFWARTSPVLFPIVGTLKENAFLYDGRKYSLNRHGFARDMLFSVEEVGKDHAVFVVGDNEKTLVHFPFHFQLRLKYALEDDTLNVTYEVTNRGMESMYFSIGGHPAFKTPLIETSRYEDYYLQFDSNEDKDQWPLTADGLVEKVPLPLILDSNILKLTRELFYQDAIVFKHLKSQSVSLKCKAHDYGVDLYFGEFPYLGVWAARNADFVCIEPWCGVADSVSHNQELVTKEGIESVPAGESWSRAWRARFY